MRKIVNITFVKQNKIICLFNNGEERMIDLNKTLKGKYANKILNNEAVFKSALIGDFGEIYWANVAEITDLNGNKTPCEYDMSPEFVYQNSTLLNQPKTYNKVS